MLRRKLTRVCKFCNYTNHESWQCSMNPKRKSLHRQGKYYKQWIITRHEWIKKHPPTYNGLWECYLRISPYCPHYLTLDMLTLDHVKSRTRHPELRFELDDLR